MNKVIIMGRLTKDPGVKWLEGNSSQDQTCIAKYTLAVDRRFGDNGADYIDCVAFGKAGTFAEKYLKKGTKIVVTGRIQTGSYTNKNGIKIYTMDVVVEDQEFAENKSQNQGRESDGQNSSSDMSEGFMNIPDGIDEELPFT